MILEDYPILKKAPITEALIDIRVKLPTDFDVKNISSIYDSIKNKYPENPDPDWNLGTMSTSSLLKEGRPHRF